MTAQEKLIEESKLRYPDGNFPEANNDLNRQRRSAFVNGGNFGYELAMKEIEPTDAHERHSTLLVLSLRWLPYEQMKLLAKDLLDRIPAEVKSELEQNH